MNKVKQADTIRKRNAELNKQLEDLKFKLEFNSQLNMNGYQHAKDLIEDLEKIKQDWISALVDLNNKREQYVKLINDLQKIKSIMTNMGFKVPWYKKIINKLKSR
jgi:chromosome segregation ATPase